MVIRELTTKFGFKIDKTKLGSFDKKLGGIKKNLVATSSKFGMFGKAVSGGISSLDPATVALAAVTAVVAGLGMALKAATEKYLTFERGMKGVARVTLATAKELESMEDAALEAGEASIFSTGDAAEAMKFLAQAGLDVDEVITALPGALELAAAAEMDLATAADISTNILTANSLAVEDLTKVNDILAMTASKTNTDVIQLGWAFGELGSIGSMAGLEVSELSSMLGLLAKSGKRGTSAGTMFKNTLIAILSPSKKVRSLMNDLNIDINGLKDASGKFKKGALPKFFKEINAAMKAGKLGPGELITTFGKRPGQGIAAFANIGGAAIEKMNARIMDSAGTAKKAAAIAFKGLDGSMRQFSSKMDVSSVKLIKGTGLNKLFEDIVRFMSDVIPPLIDFLAIALRPIVMIVRAILFPFKLIGAVLGGLAKLSNSFRGNIQDGMLEPLERVLGFMDMIVVKVREFMQGLSDAKNGPLSGIFKFVKDIFRIFSSLIDILILGFGKLVDGIASGFAWVWGYIGPIISMLIEPIKKVFDFIQETIGMLADLLEIEVSEISTSDLAAPGKGGNSNTFNIHAPVNVAGGGSGSTGLAVREAVVSQFSIELQKVVIESGGL